MKKLAFLFVFTSIVSCNTKKEKEISEPIEGFPVEVEDIEVTDSTIILKFEDFPVSK